MPHENHKRKNNGSKIEDVDKRQKKQTVLQERTNSINPCVKRGQKVFLNHAALKEEKNGYGSFRLSSEPKRFGESFALSTKLKHEILIRDETLDGDTSCSSQEVDFILETATGFYSGKGDVSASSSESMPSLSDKNTLLLSCEENLGEGESTNPDLPLSAIQHHSEDSDFLLKERNIVQKTFKITLANNTNTDINFDLLPEEVIVSIFRYLPLLSREKVNQVCKRWNCICMQYELLDLFPTDIYGMMIRNMRKHAKTMKNYFSTHIHLELNVEMRATLVDWLIEVCEECEMDSETLFLTINYVDRYLSAIGSSIPRHRLQLLGMTSLLIASKYEEMEIPTISDLIYLSDNSYTREEVTGMEASVLNVLKFDITVFTVKRFVEYYIHLLFEEASVFNKVHQAEVSAIAHYFAELSLINYELAISSPNVVGCAIVSIALNSCGLNAWPHILKAEAHLSHRYLESTISTLLQLHVSIHTNAKMQSIRNKQCYSTIVSKHLPKMIYTSN